MCTGRLSILCFPILTLLPILPLLTLPSVCQADSLVTTFSTPNGFVPPAGGGPWATLSLTLNADATITVDVHAAPGFELGNFLFNPPGGTGAPGLSVSALPTNWFFFPDGEGLTDYIGGSLGVYEFASMIDNQNVFMTPHAPLSDLTFTLTEASGFTSVYNLVNPAEQCPMYACSGGFVGPDFAIVLENVDGTDVGEAYASVPQQTPEPSSFALLGLGLVGLLAALRRNRCTPLRRRACAV